MTQTPASRQVLRQLATRYGIVGESNAMLQVMSRLLQVAPTDLTVLIAGETGTGKEVFAHAVHELSERRKYPFISVNCGAIPETLLESELFGAEKGAYTGSVEQRKGFFEAANRGTIFLDEIGEMPIGTQVKLLRILESGEFSRLGSSDMQKVDVRVVAATNRDLAYEVRQGRFRQDLFYRLNSVLIQLPPLRQHAEDVPILARHFAKKVADRYVFDFEGFDDEALEVMTQQPWQGNVRELRNVVETMVTLERGTRITAEVLHRYLAISEPEVEKPMTALVHVPESATTPADADIQMLYRTVLQLSADVADVRNMLIQLMAIATQTRPIQTSLPAPAVSATAPSMSVSSPVSNDVANTLPTLNVEELERRAIVEALRRSHGIRRDAARLLGMSERTLYRKITDYDIME